MYKGKTKGFTLIELLVVISIIGFLATLALVSLRDARTKSRDAKRIADLKQVNTAIQLFYDQYGRYPMSLGHTCWSGHWGYLQTCLESGTNCGFTTTNFVSPMAKVPQDPLGGSDPFSQPCNNNTYYYYHCSSGSRYRLLTTLEGVSNAVFSHDIDGNFYTTDGRCNDASRGYCMGSESWCY